MPQANYEPKIEQVVQDYPNQMPNPNQIQVIFLMDPKDLKPHPLNEKLYNFDDDDRSDLRISMTQTYKDNGYPNTEIVYIDKNNVIYSGHRRWYSAKEEKIPVLRCMRIEDTFDKKCLTDPVLKRKELDTLSNLNYPGTKRNELAWEVVLKKYDEYNKTDEKITGHFYTPKQRNIWCRQNTKYSVENFKKMVEIYEVNRIDLIKKVDLTDISVNNAWKEALNIQPASNVKYDPDRKNWVQFFKDKPECMKKVMKYANDMYNQYVNISINGKSIPLDDVHGHEQNVISANLSHFYMSAVSLVLEEEGFKSYTPREEAGLPDIRIKDLSKKGYHPERMEVKVAKFNGHGSRTTISAGPGATRIVPHTFLLIVYDPNTHRQMVVLSDLAKEDWTSNTKNTKCEMGMNIWADNHLEDCVFFNGSGYVDSRNVFQMNMDKVDE
tara:strand:+ start:63 stop:1376 length:1314 start_codon:yes stop_codon:yes gene_type:complete